MPEASMKTSGENLEVATRMHVSQNPTDIIFSPSNPVRQWPYWPYRWCWPWNGRGSRKLSIEVVGNLCSQALEDHYSLQISANMLTLLNRGSH